MKRIIVFFVFMGFIGSLSAQNASMAKVLKEVEATTGLEDEAAIQRLQKARLSWEKQNGHKIHRMQKSFTT